MKRNIVPFLFSSLLAPGLLGDVPIVIDGKSVARIYVAPADLAPPGASEAHAREGRYDDALEVAIRDLQYHIEQMSGAQLEVVKTEDPKTIQPPAIVLGSLSSSFSEDLPESQWGEGYVIAVKDNFLLIRGEDAQATSYGVCGFLRTLGCDWVMPGKIGEIIPKTQSVTVPKQTEIATAPSFGMRRMYYRGASAPERADFEQWTRRQRLGCAEKIWYPVGGFHYWHRIGRQYPDELEKTPELLALVRKSDGAFVRKGPQLETTNPDLVALIARDIQSTFDKNGWPNDKAVTLAIGPADGDGYSWSPEALALMAGLYDPIIGGPDVTNLVIDLANSVLERLEDKYPGLSLGYYVYAQHAEFPTLKKIHPRIVAIFAPITYSRLHATNDERSKTRHYYSHIIKKWSELAAKQGNQLRVYEYNWNHSDNLLPFTRLEMVGNDLPLYRELGVSALNIETTKAWAINGPHDYLFARIAWDTSLDWKAVLAEYCEKAFGQAAPHLQSYYLRLATVQAEAGREAGSYFSAPLIFDDAYLKAAQEDVEQALAQELTSDQRLRVEAAVYPLRALKGYLDWHRAINSFRFDDAVRVYEEIVADWEGVLSKNSHFLPREAPQHMKNMIWPTTSEGKKYSSSPFQLAVAIPNELPTAIDPYKKGELLNLYGEEINDSLWIKTQTYESTWDAQGLGFYRDGSVWYRYRFTLPEKLEDDGIGLYLGGFDDEARVWLNGQAVGGSGVQYLKPSVFDLTDKVRLKEENLLVIEIRRNSNLNEIFIGGLLRPGFIFSGPRVIPSSHEDSAEEKRVIPGGDGAL